jgi:hypothetical protein
MTNVEVLELAQARSQRRQVCTPAGLHDPALNRWSTGW